MINNPSVPGRELQPNDLVSSYPTYTRNELKVGIAHLGLGNFHRSHQALFMHRLLQQQPEDWMIHGVGMLDSDRDLVQSMQSQNCTYSLTERSGTDDSIHIVGSIKEVSHGPSDTDAVIERLSSDVIRIISLTVTEKGYRNTAVGELNWDDTFIQHDLEDNVLPVTMVGYLYAVAERRMQKAGQAFTVMSCDNLPSNGEMTKRLLLQFADEKSSSVADWIRTNTTFPNSMVDRITPGVTPEARDFVRNKFAIEDACPVISESFLQWILEDKFINGRPELEKVGVQFVNSVEPYEILKTRMLNGAHSALAYTAYLMGYRKVDEAMKDPVIMRYLQHYMDEDVSPTLPDIPGIDVDSYKVELRHRFSNPAISDQIERLAQDGPAKVRSFIVPPLAHQLDKGGSIRWFTFALASWGEYLGNVQFPGKKIDAAELLNIDGVFEPEMIRSGRLVHELQDTINSIRSAGIKSALEQRLATTEAEA